MFTNKKRVGINEFVCDVSLYVVETPKASIKYHKAPVPIIPFGIVAYGFVGQPFSKQLYITYESRGTVKSFNLFLFLKTASKLFMEQLSVVVHVLHATQNLVISRC